MSSSYTMVGRWMVDSADLHFENAKTAYVREMGIEPIAPLARPLEPESDTEHARRVRG